jgi:hypothetical protein
LPIGSVVAQLGSIPAAFTERTVANFSLDKMESSNNLNIKLCAKGLDNGHPGEFDNELPDFRFITSGV